MERILEELTRLLKGWLGYYSIADVKKYLQQLSEWLGRRIRQIFWKRWKRIRTRMDNLIRAEGLQAPNAIPLAYTGPQGPVIRAEGLQALSAIPLASTGPQGPVIRLGIPKNKAWQWANTRKGYWHTANSWVLATTLTNQYLKSIGFPFFPMRGKVVV